MRGTTVTTAHDAAYERTFDILAESRIIGHDSSAEQIHVLRDVYAAIWTAIYSEAR